MRSPPGNVPKPRPVSSSLHPQPEAAQSGCNPCEFDGATFHGTPYGFNAGTGVQVSDASGQGNVGTISGATWTSSGKFGSALSFDGSTSWVTIADAPSLDLRSALTIEAWVNPSSSAGWQSVVLKETSNGLAYALYAENNAQHPSGYVHTNGDMAVNGTTALPLNTWTHLALTYDGATLRMFTNGVQVGSASAPGAAVTSSQALRIGGDSVWGEYFKGLIDEVRLYNRALTAAEIQSDMNTPVQ
jgi:Concanavalin A-like lectin/glucanases superfamily